MLRLADDDEVLRLRTDVCCAVERRPAEDCWWGSDASVVVHALEVIDGQCAPTPTLYEKLLQAINPPAGTSTSAARRPLLEASLHHKPPRVGAAGARYDYTGKVRLADPIKLVFNPVVAKRAFLVVTAKDSESLRHPLCC